jgi:hypothetical protein
MKAKVATARKKKLSEVRTAGFNQQRGLRRTCDCLCALGGKCGGYDV